MLQPLGGIGHLPRRRRLIAAIGGTFALLALATAHAADGDPVCIEGGECFTTIQAAVDAAAPGDTINVAAGAFVPATLSKANLTLAGASGATINIGESQTGLTLSAPGITVQGLAIVGPYTDTYLGIDWTAEPDNTWGIALNATATGATITGNQVRNVRTGIQVLSGATGATITNNVIDNTKGSILVRSDVSSVSGNAPGATGNEWDIVVLVSVWSATPAAFSPLPASQSDSAAYGSAVMALSAANGGMSVLDRRFADGNRSVAYIEVGHAPGPSDDFGLGNGLGNPRQPYGAIQHGVTAVAHGGRVVVRPGTYELTTKIDVAKDDLAIVSTSGAASTVIDFLGGNCPSIGGRGIRITGDGNLLEGFTVRGCDDPARSDYPIVVEGGAGNRIRANVLVGGGAAQDTLSGNNADQGTLIRAGASGTRLEQNEASGFNICGLCVGGTPLGGATAAATDSVVTGNLAHANRDGISIDRAATTTVEGNEVRDNTLSGIYFHSRDAALATGAVSGNLVQGNAIGVRIRETGASPVGTVLVTRNRLVGNAVSVGVEGDAAGPVDATRNWWGRLDGPQAGEVAGDVTTSPFLTPAIGSVSMPSAVAEAVTSVTPTVTLVNGDSVTISVVGATGLVVGTNTVTVTATLTIGGQVAATDSRTLTVARSSPATPTPTPTPADEVEATAVPTATPSPTATATPTSTPAPPVLEPGNVAVEVENARSTPVPTAPGAVAQVGTTAANGSSVQVTVPASALPPTAPPNATVQVAAIANPAEVRTQAPPPTSAAVVTDFVVNLTDEAGVPVEANFSAPVTLEFSVPAEAVPAGATSETLMLAFWNGSEWVEVEASVTFNADGSITLNAEVDHFTLFSVFVAPPGWGTCIPPPRAFGVSASVWQGGRMARLDRALGDASAWASAADGEWHRYRPGAAAFLNAGFHAAFPDGLPPETRVFVTP
ncbi:MAG: NosD domain-containing protein [Dehalococcoidia bacterium]